MKGALVGIGLVATIFTVILTYMVNWTIPEDLWNCIIAFVLLYAAMFLGAVFGSHRG